VRPFAFDLAATAATLAYLLALLVFFQGPTQARPAPPRRLQMRLGAEASCSDWVARRRRRRRAVAGRARRAGAGVGVCTDLSESLPYPDIRVSRMTGLPRTPSRRGRRSRSFSRATRRSTAPSARRRRHAAPWVGRGGGGGAGKALSRESDVAQSGQGSKT
jgi:hypothetical protein